MSFTVAAFDFDGTITYHDLLIPFFISTLGYSKTIFSAFKVGPQLLQHSPKQWSRQLVKESFLKGLIGQVSVDTFHQWVLTYTKQQMEKQIKPSAWERYQWHKAQGHYCLIISANLNLLLEPWVKQAGFDALLASDLEVNEHKRLTGKLTSHNCWGEEKVNRLIQHLGPKKNYQLYAYGNSSGDQPLLKIADFAFYKNFI